jgi:hypothetical protein
MGELGKRERSIVKCRQHFAHLPWCVPHWKSLSPILHVQSGALKVHTTILISASLGLPATQRANGGQ